MRSISKDQSAYPVMIAFKMQYVEQIADGYEEIPAFRIACTINQDKKFSPDELLGTAQRKLFPEGMQKAIVSGYDYLVLRAHIDGNEILLMPGTIVFVREDGHIGVIVTSNGVPEVSIEDGKLVLV